jgi:hypothetical protein
MSADRMILSVMVLAISLSCSCVVQDSQPGTASEEAANPLHSTDVLDSTDPAKIPVEFQMQTPVTNWGCPTYNNQPCTCNPDMSCCAAAFRGTTTCYFSSPQGLCCV